MLHRIFRPLSIFACVLLAASAATTATAQDKGAVRTKFNFKMSIARWSLHRDLAFQREGKTSQTAQTFPVWTAGYQEPTANDAGFCRLCPALLRCPADRTVLGPRHVVGASRWVSGDEYPVKIFQLIVDLCRVGHGARHLSSQRVAITLAQA